MSSGFEFETEMWELEADDRQRSLTTPAVLLQPVEIPGGGRIRDLTPPKPSEIVKIMGIGGKTVPLHYLAAKAYEALVQAARADGIRSPLLLPISGYRSIEKQKKLWEEGLKKHGTPEKTRKWVAPPGGSAHQTGRAIDFYVGGSNRSENVAALRMLPAFKWLVSNARRFGFYPYEREPWHWEYNPPSSTSQIGKKENTVRSTTTSVSASPASSGISSYLYKQAQDLVRKGMLTAEVMFALIAGERDENKLTNMIFYSRYPAMEKQKKLARSDPKAREWLQIRNELIRPILAKISLSLSKPASLKKF